MTRRGPRRSLVVRVLLVVLAVLSASAACGGGGGARDAAGSGALDPRCESLCATTATDCNAKVASCEAVCQIRVTGMAPTCATCLLEQSNGGVCADALTCCPSPEFPMRTLDCASACAGSVGVNPSVTHPICAALCASDDASCQTDAAHCVDTCQARIHGVSGLCALCLLDRANGGSCTPGAPCCPHPEFPTSANACASLCS
jgi:hypothetical protein